MRRGTLVTVMLAAATLSACGQQVGQRTVADRVVASARGGPDVGQHVPMRGFDDFPTWMPHKVHPWQHVDDADFVPQPIALPDCPGGTSPHFDTPEAAMTYLASAWHRDDLADLCQVTNPNARLLLLEMHREAVNLRLSRCDYDEVGHYTCVFDHDYPKRMHKTGVGHTFLDVASADIPGWYMTVYEGCG